MLLDRSVFEQIKKTIMRVSDAVVSDLNGVIEKDYNLNPAFRYNRGDSTRRTSLSLMMSADAVGYNSYEEHIVLQERLWLIGQIEEVIKKAKQDLSLDNILVPSGLMSKISQEILNMSQNEPCGLRGCVVYINFEGSDVCHKIGKFSCDPDTVPTFEIYLTLKESPKKWTNIAKAIPVLEKLIRKNNSVLISAGYFVEKRKLYGRHSRGS